MSYIYLRVNTSKKTLKMSQTVASENQESVFNALVRGVVTKQVEEYFEKAVTLMDDLAKYLVDTIEKEEEPLEQTASQYVFACVAIIKRICLELSSALAHDNITGGRNISPTRLSHFLRRVRGAADLLNFAFQASYPTVCLPRIVILYRPTFKCVCVRWEKPATVKFLKEIVVAHDESVTEDKPNCDCPICYENVTSTEAIYTNCNHGFCVTCIKGIVASVWKSTEEKKPVCPMCRDTIIDLKGGLEAFNEVKHYLSIL
jgi:hypothetical protein